jgi:hypothetical protein
LGGGALIFLPKVIQVFSVASGEGCLLKLQTPLSESTGAILGRGSWASEKRRRTEFIPLRLFFTAL